MSESDDSFELYDLRVEIVVPKDNQQRILCGAKEGDYFEVKGEMITMPENQGFSMYSLGKLINFANFHLATSIGIFLAAVLPLLAAKQRCRDKNDWMWTDALVACPDPNCPTKLRIVRTDLRVFKHGDTTVVPLEAKEVAVKE